MQSLRLVPLLAVQNNDVVAESAGQELLHTKKGMPVSTVNSS
jgi:hypothetical protein